MEVLTNSVYCDQTASGLQFESEYMYLTNNFSLPVNYR